MAHLKRRTIRVLVAAALAQTCCAFAPRLASPSLQATALHLELPRFGGDHEKPSNGENLGKQLGSTLTSIAAAGLLSVSLAFSSPAWAENELSAKYGGGLDTSLVDQTCLVNQCSVQSKACLVDDPDCRKGLTCTAKCLGDNACITGCMARYGNKNLDNLLKCTIEDNECIKVAILDGGADAYGEEPRAPAPTVRNFDVRSLEGSWYKVVGYNPNYDCYACQRNTFTAPASNNNLLFINNDKQINQLNMDVEFSMPHLLPDGSPPPPENAQENIWWAQDKVSTSSQSIGLNAYNTHETMVFDTPSDTSTPFVLHKGTEQEVSYGRTAHSEGEMFGLSKYFGACYGSKCGFNWNLTCMLCLQQNSGRTGM